MDENKDKLKEYRGILKTEKSLEPDLVRNYITSRIEERTELTKDEARGFSVLYSISKNCGWDLITNICEEFYHHMRSHGRLGIAEDIALVKSSIPSIKKEEAVGKEEGKK